MLLPSPKKTNRVSSEVKTCRFLPLSECLAKTYHADNKTNIKGRTVFEHCHIVGEVAREIMVRLPAWLCEELFPQGCELIAGAHDVGKISPTFQEKIYRGIDGYNHNSKQGLENATPVLEKSWGGHAGVSQATVDKDGINAGKFIPEILGQHHGYSSNLSGKTAIAETFGGNEWQEQREQCIKELKIALNCFVWPKIANDYHALAIAGLVTVADWIGSGYFEDPKKSWQLSDIQQALDEAGFVPPKLIHGLLFKDIFTFDFRSAQKKLFENAIKPGVYIMEAPMGLGKTEAALYAAYLAMTSGKATGIYFALPTQLTSNKIHERVNQFLEKILAPDCCHREALLLHGNSWLRLAMGEDAEPGGSWFHAKKRGILAPFAVGTIDQALMAVMNVKHGFVRTFGLAGKVVILDEVHSYDTYTGTILDHLVNALKELHCTVIILSATLTQKRRHALLGQPTQQENITIPKQQEPYPLISVLPKNHSILQEIPVAPLPDSKVTIYLCQDDTDNPKKAIDEALLRAEQGQQVLWIENTVAESQAIYKLLSARTKEMNVACGLLHSRFLKIDRENIEKQWVDLYGKNGENKRQEQGRILVGTQVLEQSLDIDADFLVTRLCPTDMLLQRLGRLWRHKETPRPKSATQEAWIMAPTLTDTINNLEKAFGKSSRVYSPYVLYRSLEIWEKVAESQSILLPKDIRFLLEKTYADRQETNDRLNRAKFELIKQNDTRERLAQVVSSKGIKTLPDNEASTRYSEQDTVDVLLFKSYRHTEDKSGTYITLLSGEEIYLPKNGNMQNKQRRRKLAATLINNTVRVAEYLAPNALSAKSLEWLKDYLYLGDKYHEESLLRVAKVQKSNELRSLSGGVAADKYCLSYDAELGYFSRKIKKIDT